MRGDPPLQIDFKELIIPPLKKKKIAVKSYKLPFLLLPTSYYLLGGRSSPKNPKKKKIKRGVKVLNLIAFELESLKGKLILITYLF